MSQSILSRYLDPEVLSRIARRRLQPRGLVLGNLAGAHRSPLSGFAVEFAGHREYVWGDDPKHIDWRIYFRRDRYFIKQYEMETNLVCHLVLDCSASMRYGQGRTQKLRYACQMLAALAYAVLRQSDKVSLATFDDRVRDFIPPTNSMAQLLRITQVLDQVQPVAKTDMAGCLAELAGRMKRREIVMIFSDFFTELPPLEKALQWFRYHRHEVILFQIMHHDELSFELEGMTKFVGLEVPEELLAQPEAIRQAYLDAVQSHNRQLEDICLRNRLERVVVDTSQDMAAVLVDYLNARTRRRWRR